MFQKEAKMFGFILLLVVIMCGQVAQAQKDNMSGPQRMTRAQKIAFAMGAAPANISRHATIMDMTDMAKPKQLRAGTNGWMCAVMVLGTNNEAMCMDKEWQKWAGAWMNKTEPNVETTGIAYMLRGDKGASNTDPYAMGPTADNQWVKSPPHIMVLYADPKMLDAYPTDPKNGGPWVMWKGTPYAHVMVPVSATLPVIVSK